MFLNQAVVCKRSDEDSCSLFFEAGCLLLNEHADPMYFHVLPCCFILQLMLHVSHVDCDRTCKRLTDQNSFKKPGNILWLKDVVIAQ